MTPTQQRPHCQLYSYIFVSIIHISKLTFNNLVIDSFFCCYNQIKLFLCILEPLRSGLYSPVTVQHVKDSILCVSDNAELRKLSDKTAFFVQIMH